MYKSYYYAVRYKNGWKLFTWDKIKRFTKTQVVPISCRAELNKLNMLFKARKNALVKSRFTQLHGYWGTK